MNTECVYCTFLGLPIIPLYNLFGFIRLCRIYRCGGDMLGICLSMAPEPLAAHCRRWLKVLHTLWYCTVRGSAFTRHSAGGVLLMSVPWVSGVMTLGPVSLPKCQSCLSPSDVMPDERWKFDARRSLGGSAENWKWWTLWNTLSLRHEISAASSSGHSASVIDC